MILCGVFALAVGALWAIPAAIAGGQAYAQDILWRQMAGRAVDAFAHARPFWWYAAFLPVLLAPWIVLPALWRALIRVRLDPALGICLLWILLPFFVFSMLSGKQPHYLLPLFPPVALLFGRAISSQADTPITWSTRVLPAAIFFLGGSALSVGVLLSWLNYIEAPVSLYPNMLLPAMAALGLSRPLFRLKNLSRQVEYLGMATFVFLTTLALGVVSSINERFDLRPLAAELRQLKDNRPLAFMGKYAGEFHYAAHLQKPFAIVKKEEVLPWLLKHENGIVIARDKEVNSILPLVCQPYRSNRMCLFEAPTFNFKQHLVWYDKPKR
jgi:4-amino-4-deoxy-L-arabinose transferase-like glycosyltransferase